MFYAPEITMFLIFTREFTRVNIYNALVMPYFNYCGAVWGNINKGLADKLQKLQNRAARILTFSNYDVRSSVLLDELGWERLEYVRLKQGGKGVNVSRDSDGTGILNLNLHPPSRVTFINVSIVLKNCYAFSNFIIPSNCSPLTTFILSLQEHPTTVFSKISVRRSKYCLEFSIN